MGSGDEDTGGGGGAVRGAVLKALVVVGGVLLLRRLRRSTTRWDHARAVADALSGEKVSPPRAPPWRIVRFPGDSDEAAWRIRSGKKNPSFLSPILNGGEWNVWVLMRFLVHSGT